MTMKKLPEEVLSIFRNGGYVYHDPVLRAYLAEYQHGTMSLESYLASAYVALFAQKERLAKMFLEHTENCVVPHVLKFSDLPGCVTQEDPDAPQVVEGER